VEHGVEEKTLLWRAELVVRCNGDQHSEGPFGFTVTVGFMMRGVTVMSEPLTMPKLPTSNPQKKWIVSLKPLLND
jgi:hypothetical protein